MLASSIIALACGPADAAIISHDGDQLTFTELDALAQNHDVTVTETSDSLIFKSIGDVISAFNAVPCVYSNPPAQDTITCEKTNINFLAVLTGQANDKITVDSSLPTVLCGGPGTDTISGGAGADKIFGAAGDDLLVGGDGEDILRAETAPSQEGSTASLCTADPGSATGSNTLDGGAGSDLLVGDDGRDHLHGGAGDDVAFGRPGDDALDGGDGDDLLVGLDGADQLDGGPGTDVLSGGDGADVMSGGAGRDDLAVPVLLIVDPGGPVEASIETGDDVLNGDEGDDTLYGGPANRTVTYGVDAARRAGGGDQPNGADVLIGGPGIDQVSYVDREIPVSVSLNGQPDDGSAGEADNVASDVERVTGGSAADAISGGPGDDSLDGGPGSDKLDGLGGADTVDGGAADDGADAIAGGAGPDTLRGGPGADAIGGGDGNDTLQGGGGTDRLDGAAGDDGLSGDADADSLAGGAGADVLDGGAGRDVADYTAAASAVTVSLDEVRNDGVKGEDWVRNAEDLRGGAGDDALFGNAAINAIEGGRGADIIDPGGGRDSVRAGPGRDAVLAREDTRDSVACGAGADLALVDELDSLQSGRERCERVDTGARPRRGEALLRPGGCELEVRLPGMSRALALKQSLSAPRGTSVDPHKCVAALSTARRGVRLRARGGAFALRRVGGRGKTLGLALTGSGLASCRTAPPARRVRMLTVQVRGSGTLRARFASAAGRNASWTMEDRCGSTLTRVRSGSVRVLDRGDRRPVVVHAGGSHVSAQRPRKVA